MLTLGLNESEKMSDISDIQLKKINQKELLIYTFSKPFIALSYTIDLA